MEIHHFYFADEEIETQKGQMTCLRPCILISGSQDLDLFPLIPIQFFETMQTENNFLNEHSARAMCLEGLLS